MDRAIVVGTGLIGTSVALALTGRGVTTYLVDADPDVAKLAADLGAGIAGKPADPVDLAILAVPPAHVARVLADAQHRGLAVAYTDVASVKARPQHELEALACESASFVGGHPLAGGSGRVPARPVPTCSRGGRGCSPRHRPPPPIPWSGRASWRPCAAPCRS
jgi:prephenate dehydrogenase